MVKKLSQNSGSSRALVLGRKENRMDRIFEWYKRDLMRLHEQHGQLRMIVIEYVCGAPKIDPVVMARSLVDSGCRVVFDDSSIPFKENEKKRRRVYG